MLLSTALFHSCQESLHHFSAAEEGDDDGEAPWVRLLFTVASSVGLGGADPLFRLRHLLFRRNLLQHDENKFSNQLSSLERNH